MSELMNDSWRKNATKYLVKVHTSDFRHRDNYICTSTTNIQWSNIMNKLQEWYCGKSK